MGYREERSQAAPRLGTPRERTRLSAGSHSTWGRRQHDGEVIVGQSRVPELALLVGASAFASQGVVLGTRSACHALVGGGPLTDAALIAAGLLGVAGGALLPITNGRRFLALLAISGALSASFLVGLGALSSLPLPRVVKGLLAALVLGAAASPLGAVLPAIAMHARRTTRLSRLYAVDLLCAAVGVAIVGTLVANVGVVPVVIGGAALALTAAALLFPRAPAPDGEAEASKGVAHLSQPLLVDAVLLAAAAGLVQSALPSLIAPATARLPFVPPAVVAGAMVGGACGSYWASRGAHPQAPAALLDGALALVLVVAAAALGSGPLLQWLSSTEISASWRLLVAGVGVALLASPPAIVSGAAAARAIDAVGPRAAVAATAAAAAAAAFLTALVLDHAPPRAALLAIVVGAVGVGIARRPSLRRAGLSAAGIAVCAAPVIAGAGADLATRDLSRALLGRDDVAPPTRRRVDGWDATGHIVVTEGRDEVLYRDGKPDASSLGDLDTQTLLAALPLAARPDAERALVIGLGSGRTARVLDDAGVEVEVVEFSRIVREAFGSRLGTRTILHDAEARAFLSAPSTTERFDLITAEPTNLFVAGQPRLVSAEALLAMRRALTPEGVVTLWTHAYHASETSFALLVRTVGAVFPHVNLFVGPTSDVLIVASGRPIALQGQALERRLGEQRACVLAALDHVDGSGLATRYVGLGPGDGDIERDLHPRLAALSTDALMKASRVKLSPEPLPGASHRELFLDRVRREDAAFRLGAALRRRLDTEPLTAFEGVALLRSAAGRKVLADHASTLAFLEEDPSPPWARPLLTAGLAVGRGQPDVDALLDALASLGTPGCGNDVVLDTGMSVARLSARFAPSRAADIAAALVSMSRPGRRAQRLSLASELCEGTACCDRSALVRALALTCRGVSAPGAPSARADAGR